jgi:hypothetical protein
MTNDEILMTNEFPNDPMTKTKPAPLVVFGEIRPQDFVIGHFWGANPVGRVFRAFLTG